MGGGGGKPGDFESIQECEAAKKKIIDKSQLSFIVTVLFSLVVEYK